MYETMNHLCSFCFISPKAWAVVVQYINCSALTAAPPSSGEQGVSCIYRIAGLKLTRTPTQNAEVASPPDVVHLHNERKTLSYTDVPFTCYFYFLNKQYNSLYLFCMSIKFDPQSDHQTDKLLTCAFTQSCFEALQETVEEQFSSGQTGWGSRWTVTLPPFTGRFCWITAAQQWTDGKIVSLQV